VYASTDIIRVIKIKEDKMGGTCSTHRKDEKCVDSLGWKT